MLLRACDGRTTTARLTAAVDADPVEATLAIDDLARRRLLVVDCRTHVTNPRALEWLAAFVASLPADCRSAVA